MHIYLYRKRNDEYEYAVFQRKEMLSCWQGVCGGVEGNETLEEAARRELFEEAGVKDALPLYRLESISYLPVNIFSEKTQTIWGEDKIVIPMYHFAMPFDGKIKLSDEHENIKWLNYEKANSTIYFHDQQNALYELNERLLRKNISFISDTLKRKLF